VESPTSGSMLLAGLLLKFGTMGFLRFVGSIYFLNFYLGFLVVLLGVIICSFVCIVQRDSKSLVAYSSVVHIRFLLLIILVLSTFTKRGSLIIILSHGYVSTIIFFYVGEFYLRRITRIFYFMGGIFFSNFLFCYFFSFFILLNSGAPPSLSFLSDFLGVVLVVNYYFLISVLIFIYFLFSFYYCLFVLVNIFLGRAFLSISYLSIILSLSFFYMNFNIIWFIIF